MRKTIGTPRLVPFFAKPPCEWKRGCNRAADCTGLVEKHRMGNVCSRHKAMGDRLYARR